MGNKYQHASDRHAMGPTTLSMVEGPSAKNGQREMLSIDVI